MKIKRMLEFTNYSDDVTKNIPKELTDVYNDIDDIDHDVYITPELEDVFHQLVKLTIQREYEQIDDILMDLDDMDRKEMVDSVSKLFDDLLKKFKFVANQN